MRRTILTFSAIAFVAAMATIGSTVASGQTDIHLVGQYADAKVRLVDVHDDGIGVGDRGVVRQPLLDATETTSMGVGLFDCVVVRGTRDEPRLWICTAVLKLQGGQLMVQGLDPAGYPSEGAFAVTGGTGTYAGAHGDGTWTDTKTKTHYAIHLAA